MIILFLAKSKPSEIYRSHAIISFLAHNAVLIVRIRYEKTQQSGSSAWSEYRKEKWNLPFHLKTNTDPEKWWIREPQRFHLYAAFPSKKKKKEYAHL